MKILRCRKFCGWPHEQSRFGVPLQFPADFPAPPRSARLPHPPRHPCTATPLSTTLQPWLSSSSRRSRLPPATPAHLTCPHGTTPVTSVLAWRCPPPPSAARTGPSLPQDGGRRVRCLVSSPPPPRLFVHQVSMWQPLVEEDECIWDTRIRLKPHGRRWINLRSPSVLSGVWWMEL
jgi:hypothetical protein